MQMQVYTEKSNKTSDDTNGSSWWESPPSGVVRSIDLLLLAADGRS